MKGCKTDWMLFEVQVLLSWVFGQTGGGSGEDATEKDIADSILHNVQQQTAVR